ncbi:ABC transporter ATP-binding protein [Seongchinamella unica]|uniref:ABC transporter ATP-binding protein n=1 Tax=Seongchinamella unica TaxID=2547392 RepID=A0A4R5LW26_9GAMM|nr:ABC transporter ATP-binding protein [Seongchinamella unica]TDG15458.1 ABC transporter ATP-binding protein [Seongchinamella unica]
MTELAIETRGLSKQFGDLTAVSGLDLEIPRGEIYGFLGPNGSGKTTAIRMLCGLLTPSAGDISVLGLEIPRDAEQLRRRIGYMTQKFSLYDDLSVSENMHFMARIYGMARSAARDRVSQLLDRYSLGSMRGRLAGAMSGGQRQRLALAVATLHQPDLLILDEPTSAVDPENRRDFWEKLFDLIDEGATVLVSTHYMDEAERCHQLAILETGHLRKHGAPQDLMEALAGRVIEIEGADLRQVKERLLRIDGVQSAAQQGLHLRILMAENGHTGDAAISRLHQELAGEELRIHVGKPSLEDVFVACTRGEVR